MTLPNPFSSAMSIKSHPAAPTQKQHQQHQPKVSNFYRDPQHQQQQPQREFTYYCKFCKEGFPTAAELSTHRRNHVKCPYDECHFNANEATVAGHIQRAHVKQSGPVKIQDLTTPEQVEKWREERRKRYPTTQNVILRQQLQEEKNKRGERLRESNSRFGDQKQKNFVKNMGKRSQQPHNGNNNRPLKTRKNLPPQNQHRLKFRPKTVEPQVEKVASESDDDEDVQRKTPRFTGTLQMKNYHAIEAEVKEKPALSILGMYGSDSDSETNEEEDEPRPSTQPEPQCDNVTTAGVQPPVDNAAVSDDNEIKSDGEAPEEVPTVREESPQNGEEKQSIAEDGPKSRKRKRQVRKTEKAPRMSSNGLDYSKIKRSVNPFLEKLLQRDIVHERNALLQCVNFVVRNNFFGVGQSEAESVGTSLEQK